MPMLADKSDVARQLKELNKSYYTDEQIREMFIDTSIAEQRAVSSLNYDYAQAVNDAYMSSLQNRQSIYDSALGQGYKQQLVQQNQADLQSAFEQYRSNYMTNLSNINENFASTNQSILNLYQQQNEAATEQSNLINDYFTEHFNYLQYLNENNPKLLDARFNDFFNTVDGIRTFKSTDEIMNASSDKTGKDGGFYYTDDEGNQYITDYGRELISLLESIGTLDDFKGYSFGTYLEETNKELWEWASTYSDEYGMTGSELFRNLANVEDYIVGYDRRIRDVADKWENEFVTLTKDNIIDNNFVDDTAVKQLSSKQWKIDSSEVYTADQFKKKVSKITAGQKGDPGKKRGSIVKNFANAINEGTIKNGTIVDVNYGEGEKFYVYWNDSIYRLTDGTP